MFAVEIHVGQPTELVVAESRLATVALRGPDRPAAAVVLERLLEDRGAQRRDAEQLVLRIDGVPRDPRRTVRSGQFHANDVACGVVLQRDLGTAERFEDIVTSANPEPRIVVAVLDADAVRPQVETQCPHTIGIGIREPDRVVPGPR